MYTHVESLAWHLALFVHLFPATVLLFPPPPSHEKVARSDAVLMQVASEGPTKPFPGPKPTMMFVQCDNADRASLEVSPQ